MATGHLHVRDCDGYHKIARSCWQQPREFEAWAKMATCHLYVREWNERNDGVDGSCQRQQRYAKQNERVWQAVDRLEQTEFVLWVPRRCSCSIWKRTQPRFLCSFGMWRVGRWWNQRCCSDVSKLLGHDDLRPSNDRFHPQNRLSQALRVLRDWRNEDRLQEHLRAVDQLREDWGPRVLHWRRGDGRPDEDRVCGARGEAAQPEGVHQLHEGPRGIEGHMLSDAAAFRSDLPEIETIDKYQETIGHETDGDKSTADEYRKDSGTAGSFRSFRNVFFFQMSADFPSPKSGMVVWQNALFGKQKRERTKKHVFRPF